MFFAEGQWKQSWMYKHANTASTLDANSTKEAFFKDFLFSSLVQAAPELEQRRPWSLMVPQ
jgi:hypothetical protein